MSKYWYITGNAPTGKLIMNNKRILFFIPNSMIFHDKIANSIVIKQILQLQKLGYVCLLISSDIDRNSARLAEKKMSCDFAEKHARRHL